MTLNHDKRANGDSFFKEEDLINLKAMIEFNERKSNGKIVGVNHIDLLKKVDSELKYIEGTKCHS